MRSCFVLLFVSLLTSCEAQGTFEPIVFVPKGRDLLLKLHDDPPEGVLFVDWKINKTVTLVRIDPSGKTSVLPNVTGGFEFPEIKFSVILKNLQEADSGVYSAVASTSTGDKPVAEYKVTVQGPVSPVELIVDRVDSSGSESCDIHVTCTVHNSNISSTFKCPKGVCSQGEGERSEVTTSGASLKVYLLNNAIICKHRNQAHWSQDSIPAEDLCPSKSGTFGTPVFVRKGRDLLLKLDDDPPEGFSFVDWKINKKVTLRFDVNGTPSVLHNVAGGFEFPEIKFSVILKNLQEADSRVYSAVAKTSTGDKPVAKYKVTVQGPVCQVELTVDRVDSSSSESCDIHVTCMIPNSHISSTFKCPKGVCRQEGGERSEVTTSGASLHVYLLNNLIICKHRNQAHWSQDSIPAEHRCPSKYPPLHPGWTIATCILTLIILLALIMIVGLIVWLYNRRRRLISSSQRKEDNLQEVPLVEMSLLDKRPASGHQDGSTKSQEDAVQEFLSLLNTRAETSPPPDGTPADPDPGSTTIQEAAAQVETPMLQNQNPTPAPPQDGTPADPDPGSTNNQEDAVQEVTLEPQIKDPAPPQDGTPADPDPGSTKNQEDAVQGLEKSPLIAASAPPQDGTPADPDPGSTNNQEDAVQVEMSAAGLQEQLLKQQKQIEKQQKELREELEKQQKQPQTFLMQDLLSLKETLDQQELLLLLELLEQLDQRGLQKLQKLIELREEREHSVLTLLKLQHGLLEQTQQ